MRINDEYIFREDLFTLDVIFEPHETRYITPKDILNNHIDLNFYSTQLFIDDKCDIITLQNIKEEFIINNNVKFSITSDEKDSLITEDKVIIDVYEENICIHTITI